MTTNWRGLANNKKFFLAAIVIVIAIIVVLVVFVFSGNVKPPKQAKPSIRSGKLGSIKLDEDKLPPGWAALTNSTSTLTLDNAKRDNSNGQSCSVQMSSLKLTPSATQREVNLDRLRSYSTHMFQSRGYTISKLPDSSLSVKLNNQEQKVPVYRILMTKPGSTLGVSEGLLLQPDYEVDIFMTCTNPDDLNSLQQTVAAVNIAE